MKLLGRTHLSAHEIASLALDGLPETKRGVQLLADRCGWAWVDRVGRGGGKLYSVADLPLAAQRDLVDRWASTPRATAPRGRPKGTDFFTRHPDVAAAIEVLISERELSAPHVRSLLVADGRFGDLPTERHIRRFIARLEAEKPALLASVRDPDLYKSKYRLALGRADASITHAHQVWEIDTTKADVLCKEGRLAILGIVDVWSRRVRYQVVPSESAQSVRRILTDTIRAWGVMPETLRTDHGSGFINHSIVSALPALDIELSPCPPGSPEKKPFVERMFGTFNRERAALLAGFTGHSVADAQRLRGKAKKATGRAVIVPELTGPELQTIIDNWLDGVYHQRVHSGIGVAPIARYTASPVPARRAPSEEALLLALSALVGTARVTKRGLRWKNGRYWNPALAAWMGRDVVLRRDEDDLGALFVFDGEGNYLCTAVDHARSGLSQERFSIEARRQMAEFMKDQRADLRAKAKSFSFDDARDALLRSDAEQAGKLVTLPVATTSHSTPMLASVSDTPPVLPDAATIAAADARARTARAAPLQLVSFADRVADADRLLTAAAAGEAVDPDALRSARAFATSAEYRAAKFIAADFANRSGANRPAPVQAKRENSL